MPDSGDANKVAFDFELHYGLSHKSARDVLHEILEDLSSYKHIHNWEYKFVTSPLTGLASLARSYLNKKNRGRGDDGRENSKRTTRTDDKSGLI